MSLRQILDAKCPPTTLDLMLDEQKVVYLEHTCSGPRIASALEKLAERASTGAQEASGTEGNPYPTSLPRREPLCKSTADKGALSADQEKFAAAEKEKVITGRINALKLNAGLLRHFVVMAARWQLPATEDCLRKAARILLACGDTAVRPFLHIGGCGEHCRWLSIRERSGGRAKERKMA